MVSQEAYISLFFQEKDLSAHFHEFDQKARDRDGGYRKARVEQQPETGVPHAKLHFDTESAVTRIQVSIRYSI